MRVETDNGKGAPPKVGKETAVMKVQRLRAENDALVQEIQAKDDETQRSIGEQVQSTLRRLRLGELRVKKRNGGLSTAETEEAEELEEE